MNSLFKENWGKDILIESQEYVIDEGMLFHFYYPRGKQRDVTNAIKQLGDTRSTKDRYT